MLVRMEDALSGDAFDRVLRCVNAIRGTEYIDPVGSVLDGQTVQIPSDTMGNRRGRGDPQLLLGNLVVPEECFEGATTPRAGSTTGCPVMSIARLEAVNKVLAEARARARAYRSGDSVLVLPELGVPRAWFREVASYVTRYGDFGLIAGLEYLHDAASRTVLNQVYAVIPGPYGSTATLAVD